METALRTVIPVASIIGVIASIVYTFFVHKKLQDLASELGDTVKIIKVAHELMEEIFKKTIPEMVAFRKETKNIQHEMKDQMREQDETIDYIVRHQETMRGCLSEVTTGLTTEDGKSYKSVVPDKFEYYEEVKEKPTRRRTISRRTYDNQSDDSDDNPKHNQRRRGRY